MPTPPEIPSQNSAEIRRVANAVRFALTCLVVGLSYPTIRLGLTISTFSRIAGSMMKGKPLPGLTHFVFTYQFELVRLAIGLPVAAVVMLFVPRRVLAIYVLGALVMLTVLLGLILWQTYFDFGLELVKDLS